MILFLKSLFHNIFAGLQLATTQPIPPEAPVMKPTLAPTSRPTSAPTSRPTSAPTSAPTSRPTSAPTSPPTAVPTSPPTAVPTAAPTSPPTAVPTAAPTAAPTPAPTSVGLKERLKKIIQILKELADAIIDALPVDKLEKLFEKAQEVGAILA